MTEKALINAINQTAKDLGFTNWISVRWSLDIPTAMKTLATVLWTRQTPDNEHTSLIREQQKHFFEKGYLKFD